MTAVTEPSLLDIVRAATATVMEVPQGEMWAGSSFSDDLGADSLAMIEIVEVAEELMLAAGVRLRIDDETLASLTTLSDLTEALRLAGAVQKGRGAHGASS